MSKTINSQDFGDTLAQYGIGFLTSEACNYGMRMRYDVSRKGMELFEEAFNVTVDLRETPRNMNSTVFVRGKSREDSEPALYGLMLTYRQAVDLLLFALVHDHRHHVVVQFTPKAMEHGYWVEPYFWIGSSPEWTDLRDDLESKQLEFVVEHYDWQIYAKSHDHPHVGSMNIHKFSGRSR